MSSDLVKSHLQCEDCGHNDCLSVFTDHSYCHSCGKIHRFDLEEDFGSVSFQYMSWGHISRSTMEFFNVKTKVSDDGGPIELGFVYPNGRTKVRNYNEKKFRVVGVLDEERKNKPLFGMDRFPAGSAKSITITEGEKDTLAIYEMMGKYPVVSISSAQAGKKEVALAHEYLNSFDRIYLCLDSDIPGQEATREIAAQFDFNKIFHVKMERKDAYEYLENSEAELFKKLWWNSKRFLPEGIVSTFSEIDSILDSEQEKPAVPYPFPTLENMTYGVRTGEVVLLTALEGIGKTEIFRAIEYSFLKNTDENIGIIHLEEGKSRMIKGLAGYELSTPVHLPDSGVSKDEIKKAFRDVVRRDERIHIYTHFDSDDLDVILGTIRFLVASCGCKRVFLDHITMLVTGRDNEDERRSLDYLSTRFEWLVEELDFTLFLISHVNDEGLTRGSRNISKTADLHIHMERNKTAENEIERNTTYLTVKKNRFAGRTGPAGKLYFDPKTYIVAEAETLE